MKRQMFFRACRRKSWLILTKHGSQAVKYTNGAIMSGEKCPHLWPQTRILMSKGPNLRSCVTKGVFFFSQEKFKGNTHTRIWKSCFFFFRKTGKKQLFFLSQERFTSHRLHTQSKRKYFIFVEFGDLKVCHQRKILAWRLL